MVKKLSEMTHAEKEVLNARRAEEGRAVYEDGNSMRKLKSEAHTSWVEKGECEQAFRASSEKGDFGRV